LILNCLSKLDWLGLPLEKTAQDQKLSDALAVAEGSLQDLEKEAHRLAQLVKVVGNIKQTVRDLEVLEKRRAELPVRVQALRSDATAKSGFSIDGGADLARGSPQTGPTRDPRPACALRFSDTRRKRGRCSIHPANCRVYNRYNFTAGSAPHTMRNQDYLYEK